MNNKWKISLYLDTSVICMYFQKDVKNLHYLTQRFWYEAAGFFEIYVSEIVISEIKNTVSVNLRENYLNLIGEYDVLP